jgi:hypothetical protein
LDYAPENDAAPLSPPSPPAVAAAAASARSKAPKQAKKPRKTNQSTESQGIVPETEDDDEVPVVLTERKTNRTLSAEGSGGEKPRKKRKVAPIALAATAEM